VVRREIPRHRPAPHGAVGDPKGPRQLNLPARPIEGGADLFQAGHSGTNTWTYWPLLLHVQHIQPPETLIGLSCL
jgi:hypothetical protein